MKIIIKDWDKNGKKVLNKHHFKEAFVKNRSDILECVSLFI